jgi:hypothetical protein
MKFQKPAFFTPGYLREQVAELATKKQSSKTGKDPVNYFQGRRRIV